MFEREKSCSADQARRIRAGCHLFVELEGDPRLCDVDRDQLRRFRDQTLPSLPAKENKIRLQYGTTSVSESIAYLVGKPWPTISDLEATKRMQWLCGLFTWLTEEKWIPDDPAVGLGKAKMQGKKGAAANKKREQFTREELTKIFSVDWYQTGCGKLTAANTYREFLPLYFWLPLLGLFTGARINELSQLSLSDIRQIGDVWVFDLNEEDEDDLKRLKNENSVRRIPVHPLLIDLGLLDWLAILKLDSQTRLFPELTHDRVKGYSKAAVKWFSAFLGRFGWPRDGKKVFHSFRHTLASECLNSLNLSEATTAQISGHKQGDSVLISTYRKDVVPQELVKVIRLLDFNLPHIAPFNVVEGLKALQDALARKRSAMII